MRATAYGVGVGPGDPELLSLKAVRLIRENRVIAVPGKDPRESVAYKIAVAAVPELAGKELVAGRMPMVKDREKLAEAHKAGAKLPEEILDRGENVIYLTLGDPTVYCTFSYLQHIARRIIGSDSGRLIPFCALVGAGFVAVCDLAARMIFAPYELPAGILMSFLGGPFFLWLLVRRKERQP